MPRNCRSWLFAVRFSSQVSIIPIEKCAQAMNDKAKTIDPVCGMTVDTATALATERDGETFYLCSQHCLEKFNSEQAVTKSCCGGSNGQAHNQAVQSKINSSSAKYYCPMCEGVQSDVPGDCPKCGMALEASEIQVTKQKTIFTCPMHPEVEQNSPGSCPICGMDLEPKTITLENDEGDAELNAMTRRFWIAVVLSVPVFLLAMLPMMGLAVDRLVGGPVVSRWIQFALTTPVVLWCGWPFFVRGWRSVQTWNLNMFTLISLGVGAAYLYSTIAILFPNWIPESFRENGHLSLIHISEPTRPY